MRHIEWPLFAVLGSALVMLAVFAVLKDEAAGRAYCHAAFAAAPTAADTLAVLRDRTAHWRCEYFLTEGR